MIDLSAAIDVKAPFVFALYPSDDVVKHSPVNLFCDCRPTIQIQDVNYQGTIYENSILFVHSHISDEISITSAIHGIGVGESMDGNRNYILEPFIDVELGFDLEYEEIPGENG